MLRKITVIRYRGIQKYILNWFKTLDYSMASDIYVFYNRASYTG